MQRLTPWQRTMNILKHIPDPGPRIVRRIATLYTQETRVFVEIQNNINALLASAGRPARQYQPLETQKDAALGWPGLSGSKVAMQQGKSPTS